MSGAEAGGLVVLAVVAALVWRHRRRETQRRKDGRAPSTGWFV